MSTSKIIKFVNDNLQNVNFKIDKTEKNNENKNNPKIKKVRNPAIDVIRLICMYGIIINHILYGDVKLLDKFYRYKKELKFLHIISFWHNNGFALISGIIGYKTNKYFI